MDIDRLKRGMFFVFAADGPCGEGEMSATIIGVWSKLENHPDYILCKDKLQQPHEWWWLPGGEDWKVVQTSVYFRLMGHDQVHQSI